MVDYALTLLIKVGLYCLRSADDNVHSFDKEYTEPDSGNELITHFHNRSKGLPDPDALAGKDEMNSVNITEETTDDFLFVIEEFLL